MQSKKLSARNKRFSMLLALTVLLAMVAVSSLRTAAAGNGTDKFGPFTLTTPDGSSCGDDWALDTVQRSWSVHDNGDGTFLVRRDDKNGTFVTNGNHSPGACAGGRHGTTVSAGITGQMGGFFMFDVTSNSYNPNACAFNPGCATTTGFLTTAFGPSASYCNTICMWNFEYDSNDRTLKYRHWQDKSDNTGNDRFVGDIANQ